MRILPIVCFSIALAVFGHAQSGDYELAEIDAKANTFTAKQNGQLRTLRVRPSVDVTINGLKAAFGELEPGMKVKVTSGEPGLATKLAATGLRTKPSAAPAQPRIGVGVQPARQVKATIPANSADAFPIGDVRKGTRISLQYASGKWKCEGRIAQFSPDDTEDPKFSDKNRLVVSLPSEGGNAGKMLAIVPGGTAKKPFVFEAPEDYPGLVLRIHDYNDFSKNPGSVEYDVKILPPSR
jgi:hypothetical protein